jgi:hypothetical protein
VGWKQVGNTAYYAFQLSELPKICSGFPLFPHR